MRGEGGGFAATAPFPSDRSGRRERAYHALSVIRRALVWTLCLPIVAGGSLWAHELAYRVAGAGDEGAHLHGYLDRAPLALGILVAAALVAAVGHALGGAGGAAPDRRVFALLPPLGFTVQEHAERWLQDGGLPLTAAAEPTFLLGALLQIPFALAALLVARLLLGAVEALSEALAGAQPRTAVAPLVLVHPHGAILPRVAAAARGWGERGPPPGR
jgi:hypothetical protein